MTHVPYLEAHRSKNLTQNNNYELNYIVESKPLIQDSWLTVGNN